MNKKILFFLVLIILISLIISPFIQHKINVVIRLSNEKLMKLFYGETKLELNLSNSNLLDSFKLNLENKKYIELAKINAQFSHETHKRLSILTNSWIKHEDFRTKLIPYKLYWGEEYDLWRPDQSTSDFYPFLIMSAYFTNKSNFQNLLINTQLIKQYNYENGLPALVDIKKNRIINKNQVIDFDLDNQIFGASEIVKDGMLPLIEYYGKNDWSYEYAKYLIDKINENCHIFSKYGCLPSRIVEVNGEMLISLSRMYKSSKDSKYIDYGMPIFKLYLLKIIPENNFLPCEEIDISIERCDSTEFSISDHSNEIISGIIEFYSIIKDTHYDNEYYSKIIKVMLNKIKEKKLNEQGFWTNNNKVVDSFGYVHNAYLLYSNIDEFDIKFINESLVNIENIDLNKFNVIDDQADFIESLIYLQYEYNYPHIDYWISENTLKMMSNQNNEGLFMNDYKDGNVARTMILFLLYKTQGIHVNDWKKDLKLGSYKNDDELYVYIESESDWEGVLKFDTERSMKIFNSTYYPRINSFPEWWTVKENNTYEYYLNNELIKIKGQKIIDEGIKIKINADSHINIKILEVN
jgi:hypothetical protein